MLEATDRLERGDLVGAESLLRRAIAADQLNPDAHQLLGISLAGQQRLEGAIRCFRKVVQLRPDDAQGQFNLGRALALQGHLDEALEWLRSAAQEAPSVPDYAFELAQCQVEHGYYADAICSYEAGLALAPRSAVGWYNRGNALVAMDRLVEATASYERALAEDELLAAAWLNRAIALGRLGRKADALASVDRYVALEPGRADGWTTRGNLLLDLGRTEDAIASHRAAARAEPTNLLVKANLASALRTIGELPGALWLLDEAVRADPSSFVAWLNRGNVLGDLGRDEEALASFERAALIKPENARPWVYRAIELRRLGRVVEANASLDRADELADGSDEEALTVRALLYLDAGELESALSWFQRALQIDPAASAALVGLAGAYSRLRRYEEAIRAYTEAIRVSPSDGYALGGLLFAKQAACDWVGLQELRSRVAEEIIAGRRVATPFEAVAAGFSRQLQRKCAELHVERHAPARLSGGGTPTPRTGGRFRVGYMSADVREHPVGYQLLVLLRHRCSPFADTVVISVGGKVEDPVRDEIIDLADQFMDVSDLEDAAAVEQIRGLDLDILVDLAGHTAGGRMRLLSWRLARIQVNLYCPGTSGAPYIDYVVADPIAVPPEHADGFCEHVLRVPAPVFISDDRGSEDLPPPPSRREIGLPVSAIVLACFCESYKISPSVWRVWMAVLKAVPSAVLWLSVYGNPGARNRLRNAAAESGIEPDRVCFAEYASTKREHLTRIQQADLVIDTPEYNGHTTTIDALRAGVPVVTIAGESLASRFAASLVLTAGLGRLVASTLEEYRSLIISLATNPDALADLRRVLQRAKSEAPALNAPAIARNVERCLLELVENAT